MIKKNDHWDILDSSKIKVFMDCPRQYFYRHILGWGSTLKSRNDLEFGGAWHKAMAILSLNDYSPESVQQAYQEFLLDYRKHFTEQEDDLFPKKNPARALAALAGYTARWATRKAEYETEYVEVAGTVNVHPELPPLHFRIDNISRNKSTGKHVVIEHKTGSRFDNKWADQWQLSIQTGSYLHSLFCLYNESEVEGLIVDGAFFTAKEKAFGPENFQEVKVRRSPEHMQVWMWNTIQWIEQIEQETDILMGCSESDRIMEAFPQNPESCTKYFGCGFLDFCTSWANPLQHCETPPLGFEEQWWDPREDDMQTKMEF